MKQDSAECIIVVPFWPTQVWYPVMLKMLVSTQILSNSRKSLLVLPQSPARYIQCVEKDEHAAFRLFAESKLLSRDALTILSVSWRVGTEKRYNSHVKRFVNFCRERSTDPIQVTTEMGI